LHRNLTPGTQNKLLGRVLSAALLLAAASGLMAQDADQGSYQGPGISSAGASTIGSRSGEQLDLRFYLGVSGVVDSTLVPFSSDSHGNLIRIPNLYGVEVTGGAYGAHSWKRSQLGLNYVGSYTRYLNYDGYNSNNHSLSLGYTNQVSKRLKLDLRESAGSLSYGAVQVAKCCVHRPQLFLHSGGTFVRHPHLLPPVVGVRDVFTIRADVLYGWRKRFPPEPEVPGFVQRVGLQFQWKHAAAGVQERKRGPGLRIFTLRVPGIFQPLRFAHFPWGLRHCLGAILDAFDRGRGNPHKG